MEEASNLLTATQSCFRYTALDYVYQISVLQSKKKYEVLEALLSMLNSYGDFFRRGRGLFDDLEPFPASLMEEIQQMKKKSSTLEKIMEKRHSHIIQEEVGQGKPRADVRLEGYLFKRGQNAFRTWNRRWFYLKVRRDILSW